MSIKSKPKRQPQSNSAKPNADEYLPEAMPCWLPKLLELLGLEVDIEEVRSQIENRKDADD